MTRKKTPKKAKRKRPAPRKRAREPRDNARLSADFIADESKSLGERVKVAAMMLDTEDSDLARETLEKMLARRDLTEKLEARIVRALTRADSRVPKSMRPQGAEPQPDLNGPCTIMILIDEKLYKRWLEIHWNDPEEVWRRRLDEVPRGMLSQEQRDALKQFPVEKRAQELDRMLSRSMARK